jgi:CRISPR/Cas system CSM-associated protein Csm3 (group 7 of RAMP superfamily)
MFKRHLNELTVHFTISPDGPILIKAGDTGGVDPTRPDMEFVRAWYNGQETVYLPGSSLKGMIRAHCEKIARTVSNGQHQADDRKNHMARRLSCNPLLDESGKPEGGCGEKFSRLWGSRPPTSEDATRHSCFVCQLFGNTALASHVRLSDAYPAAEMLKAANLTEERHGVAIDRVYGSVAVGPFQFETVTRGQFQGTLTVRNFTTAQLGLLGLALRDLQAQRVSIGFAKSRGLGRIKTSIDRVSLRYPVGELLETADGQRIVQNGYIAGVAAFLSQVEIQAYGYQVGDVADASAVRFQPDGWGGLEAELAGDKALVPLQACVPAWAKVVRYGR